MKVYVIIPLDIHERAIADARVTNDSEKVQEIEDEIRYGLEEYGLFYINVTECEVE